MAGSQLTKAKIDRALFNAGAGFYVAGESPDIAAGVRLAAEVVDSGRAREVLDR